MALSRSQRILIIAAIILALIMGFLVWDFSRRTTFPGQKPVPSEHPAHEQR